MSLVRTFRWYVLVSLACAAFLDVRDVASAETIALIGTGNVGGALGRRFAENGHTSSTARAIRSRPTS
jgi:hypothetical protein